MCSAKKPKIPPPPKPPEDPPKPMMSPLQAVNEAEAGGGSAMAAKRRGRNSLRVDLNTGSGTGLSIPL